MQIKKNDFIEVEYTGRLKEEGAVFDTTDESIAKEHHLYRKGAHYGPIIICAGEKHVLKGIDDFIVGKEPGKYKIEIKPEDAFGKKNAKLIQMIPARKFAEHEIRPVPGLNVNIDGMVGLIKTVSGGRVLVDFNHPLAGKELAYDFNVLRIVTDKKEQVQSILEVTVSLGKADSEVEINGNECAVKIKKKFPKEILPHIEAKIKALCGFSKVELTAQ